MIGNNKLHLNQATLIAAVQMYLDSERKPEAKKLVVKSVCIAPSRSIADADSFEIAVEAQEPA